MIITATPAVNITFQARRPPKRSHTRQTLSSGDKVELTGATSPTRAEKYKAEKAKRSLRKMALAEDLFQGPSRIILLNTLKERAANSKVAEMRSEGWFDIAIAAYTHKHSPFQDAGSLPLASMPLELLLVLEQTLDELIEGREAIVDEPTDIVSEHAGDNDAAAPDALGALALLSQLEERMHSALSSELDEEKSTPQETTALSLLQSLEERFDLPTQAIAHEHGRDEESVNISLEGKGLIELGEIQRDKVDDLIQKRTEVRTALYRMATSPDQAGRFNDLVPKAERKQGKLDSPDKVFDSNYRGALIAKTGLPASNEKQQEIELTKQIADEQRALRKLESELQDRIKSRMEIRTVFFNRYKKLLIDTLKEHSPDELETLEDTYGDLLELKATSKPDAQAGRRMARVRRERAIPTSKLPTSNLTVAQIEKLKSIVTDHLEALRKPPEQLTLDINSRVLFEENNHNPVWKALDKLYEGLTKEGKALIVPPMPTLLGQKRAELNNRYSDYFLEHDEEINRSMEAENVPADIQANYTKFLDLQREIEENIRSIQQELEGMTQAIGSGKQRYSKQKAALPRNTKLVARLTPKGERIINDDTQSFIDNNAIAIKRFCPYFSKERQSEILQIWADYLEGFLTLLLKSHDTRPKPTE